MSIKGISNVSAQLNIPKDTLRYYDKLGLTKPKREENKYRNYTDEDLLELMYIQVLKYADFSLDEIKNILENKKLCVNKNMDIINLLGNKRKQINQKLEHLKKIIYLIDLTIEIINDKPKNDPTEVNKLIIQVFDEINNDLPKGEEKHV